MLNQPILRVLLYEGNGSRPLAEADRVALLCALLDRGYAVACVRQDGAWRGIEEGTFLVLGRFAGGPPPPATDSGARVAAHFHDIEGLDCEAVLRLVDQIREHAGAPTPGRWKPWFPVIDYSRCTNCMQCLSFCLFDVYGVSPAGKIQVQNQSNCKTDCPACSRVCPEVAILFPKYRNGPINGDEIDPEDLRREAMKVDISALLGGDIYQLLRDRSARAKSRFSKERDEERALKERQRCLAQLRQQLDVPPEVLASLPSPEEMRVRAEAARRRAMAAQTGPAGETAD